VNRREIYRPLIERTLENHQVQYLARRYDFGKESLVASLLVKEINTRMEEAETQVGIERVKPFELYIRRRRGNIRLPLFRREYLDPILAGGDFSDARELVLQRCFDQYQTGFPKARKVDVLSLIDPWALVRGRGPSSYSCEVTTSLTPYDEQDSQVWERELASIRPVPPAGRFNTLDICAPAHVVKDLTGFVVRETGLGRVTARQLVEDVIVLRNTVCPRTGELKSGEMPLLATHVNAYLSEEVATRFRRQAPVIITVWKPGEIENWPRQVPQYLTLLKRRVVRVCFEAYRQGGLLTLMDLQWIFQLSSSRISQLIRSFQKEHNIIVPTPGTVLDAGKSMTHKDIIVNLHLQGFTVKEISRITHHSPRAVDNYVGTFEAILILHLFGMPPPLMARILKRGMALVREYLQLIKEIYPEEEKLKEHLRAEGVKL